VDIFQQPSRAVRDQVIAVPMLVKELPLPIRKLIGTLSNPQQIVQAIGLHMVAGENTGGRSK
jgi:circadian clock protein KaiB